VPVFRQFINSTPHGHFITLAHGHINLLGWLKWPYSALCITSLPRLANRSIYSVRLVKVHFWMHNFGLNRYGLVLFMAGLVGGLDQADDMKNGRSTTCFVGMFGTVVLTANIIWGYNLFKTPPDGKKAVKDSDKKLALCGFCYLSWVGCNGQSVIRP